MAGGTGPRKTTRLWFVFPEPTPGKRDWIWFFFWPCWILPIRPLGFWYELEWTIISIFLPRVFFTAMVHGHQRNGKLDALDFCRPHYCSLYAYRGLGMLSLQYLIFTILAIQGYFAWKNIGQQPADCQRIVLFGPESYGKTTLAEQLAFAFQHTQWVPDTCVAICNKSGYHKGTHFRKRIWCWWPFTKWNWRTLPKTNRFCFATPTFANWRFIVKLLWELPQSHLGSCRTSLVRSLFLTSIKVPWNGWVADRPYDRSTLFRMLKRECKNIDFTPNWLEMKTNNCSLAIQTLEGRK